MGSKGHGLSRAANPQDAGFSPVVASVLAVQYPAAHQGAGFHATGKTCNPAAPSAFCRMMACLEIGYRIGRRNSADHRELTHEGIGVIEAAIFALLGLLLGFSLPGERPASMPVAN